MARSLQRDMPSTKSGTKHSRLQGIAPASMLVALLLLALPCAVEFAAAAAGAAGDGTPPPAAIVVVGSLNVDLTVPVHRLPARGETTASREPASTTSLGGKGANQAVAAARLAAGSGRAVRFVARLGDDAAGSAAEQQLATEGVDTRGCSVAAGHPTGQGVVLLEADGAASSIVLPGANAAWRQEPPTALTHIVRGAGVVLLQREVPEHVNEAIAAAAAAAGVPVLQDAGGEDRPISDALLRQLDYLAPNESELGRLTGLPTTTEEEVLAAATVLRNHGAKHVLVTLAERGALLVGPNGNVLRQPALTPPGGVALDSTGAGDAFRAAFAVALAEGRPPDACLRFAAAAGAIAVSRLGAVPSLPTRAEVEELLGGNAGSIASGSPGGGSAQQPPSESQSSTCSMAIDCGYQQADVAVPCPLQFASRLNSMSARRDLAAAEDGGDDVLGWIARQGRTGALDLVYLNHPQHTAAVPASTLQAALAAAGLQLGGINMRFLEELRAGAFSNPDPVLRAHAMELALGGCRLVADLGGRELVVWSPYDGYDYAFQLDYHAAWQHTVAAFRALADGCPPGIRVSLEWKPTDASSRFSVVPSTGAALLLAAEVDRPNFGLTLDVGHMLLGGENPAQSVALAAQAGRLFGLHLNDAHVRLGAEDGLAFGSVNAAAAMELVRWLQRVGYDGAIYFDSFPRNEDPAREVRYNVRRFRSMWARAAALGATGLDTFALRHDAMGALELLETQQGGGVAAL